MTLLKIDLQGSNLVFYFRDSDKVFKVEIPVVLQKELSAIERIKEKYLVNQP